MDRANRIYIKDYSLSLSALLVLFSLFSIVLPDRQMCQARYDGISCIACRWAHWNDIIQISFFFVDQSSTTMSRWSDSTRLDSNANVSILGLNQLAMILLVWFIYHFWMFAQGKEWERDCRRTTISSLSLSGTTFALTFLRDLRNLTVVYKPNAYVYHLCQTSHQINFKRIRWHYESPRESFNETDTHCKHLFNNSDCFEFYYGVSTSVLVIKEPDMYNGKYTCHVTMNSSSEMTSSGYIDVKLPSSDLSEDEESMGLYNEQELGKLASSYGVPFILDENDPTSFGKRVQIGGSFHTRCQSISSTYPITFLWMLLKNTSDEQTSEKIKSIHFVQPDDRRIKLDENKFSSTSTTAVVSVKSQSIFLVNPTQEWQSENSWCSPSVDISTGRCRQKKNERDDNKYLFEPMIHSPEIYSAR